MAEQAQKQGFKVESNVTPFQYQNLKPGGAFKLGSSLQRPAGAGGDGVDGDDVIPSFLHHGVAVRRVAREAHDVLAQPQENKAQFESTVASFAHSKFESRALSN